MTFSVLTIYRLFFIIQGDILFALTRDGRTLKIKKTPYFPALSSDKKNVAGISFDGEYTHILSQPFGFSDIPAEEVTALFGYFYYPAFHQNGKELATIEANLLKPRPQGELCLYQKKIKKWYKTYSLDAKMKAPVFTQTGLLFLDSQNRLIHIDSAQQLQTIDENIQIFNISSKNQHIIAFDNERINIYCFADLKKEISVSAAYITAVAFDDISQEIIYATSYENRHAIYATHIKTNKTQLLAQTQEPVILVSP